MMEYLQDLEMLTLLGCQILDKRVPLGPPAIFRVKETYLKSTEVGVPVTAQWLVNPTRNHEVAGLIPGLAQWVKDPALL